MFVWITRRDLKMKPRVAAQVWSVALCLSIGLAMASAADAAPPRSAQPLSDDSALAYASDSVLIKFKPSVGPAQKRQAYDAVGGHKIRGYSLVRGLEHLRLGRGQSVELAVERLQRLPFVEFAEPDQVLRANTNDTLYDLQWGLENTGQIINGSLGTDDADIDGDLAWGIRTGDPGFVVAVIDTGTDYNHPDLDANIWTNPGEIAGNGIDDDGNGYIDDIHGYDFSSNDADPMDEHGHGTHVAGTICAETNNGIGVAGVAQQCRIMALRFLDANGSGFTSGAISALDYAVSMGATVSNNSWGGGGFSQSLYTAIENAGAAGHLFIAASGNSSVDTDGSAHFPSSYNLDNIISVASTDNKDRLSSFSNYGATSVDVGAPGTNIASTALGSYYWMSGTSMATPHVTGLVALIWDQNPLWSHLQVRDRIYNTVRPLTALAGKTTTGGVINAYNALLEPETAPTAPSSLTATATSDTEIDLAWTDQSNNEDGFKIERSLTGAADTWTEIATAAMDVTDYTDSSLTAVTTYYYRVMATNGVGDSAYADPANATTESTPTSQDVVASAEIPGSGTVDGTYEATWTSEGIMESITERLSGGRRPSRYSYMLHTWIFEVPPGITTLSLIETSDPSSLDGDEFVFSYSLDGNSFTEMSNSSEFPANATGTVYIRVEDTDRTPGNQTLDTVSIDYIAITSAQVGGSPPAAPTGLAAGTMGSGRIDLTWADNSDDEMGFEIDRSLDGSIWATLMTVAAGATSYSDATVSADTTYYYQVRAYSGSGYSDYTNTDSATTDLFSGISLTATGYKIKGWHNVDLDWGGATGDVDIYRNNIEIASGISGPIYTDEPSAKGGASYSYQVCDTGSTSNCSTIVNVIF